MRAPRFTLPAAVLGALLTLLLAGCGGSSTPSPHGSVHPRSGPALESIIEENALVYSDPAAGLDLIRSLGVDRLRLSARWSTFAPAATSSTRPAGFNGSDPAAYSPAVWSSLDAIDRAAAADDVGLDLTLTGPAPLWAEGRNPAHGGPTGAWKPNPTMFGAFVRALGTRYGGHYTPPGESSPLPRVDFWGIWNEPNYGQNLAPQASSREAVEVAPRLYRGLLDAAWSALAATGHASDTILIGETAPRGQTVGDVPGNYGGMVPLRFIRALYCVDQSLKPLQGAAARERGCPATAAGHAAFAADNPGLFHASGFADHPYPQGANPPTFVNTAEPDYADFATLGNLASTLDDAQANYGSFPKLPIYSTEFGYQTAPPHTVGADPGTAAAYLNEAEYLSWRNPRIRSFDQYLIRDPAAAGPPLVGFASGLELKDGTPKATYQAFRMPLYLPVSSTTKGGRLELWGCVRPAPDAQRQTGRAQTVAIQFAAGGAKFTTIDTVSLTDPHGYFDVDVPFSRSGRVRLAWTDPSGRQLDSRMVSVTVT